MPMDYKRYPRGWKKMSRRLRERRAGWRCEWCGAENGKPHPITGSTVVLTVAHLGVPFADGTPSSTHDKFDVRGENLAVLCQRCHLNYDRDEHMLNRARNQARRQLKAGQLDLFGKPKA